MSEIIIPEGYQPRLDIYEMQKAIEWLRGDFQENLCRNLNLTRVSAPLFVRSDSGLNDNLSGVERPVAFDIPAAEADGEVVQSLSKWKREALGRYGFSHGEGMVTDMNAIRRDEVPDNIHSFYVDQWDWERIIYEDERTLMALYEAVRRIVAAMIRTLEGLKQRFPAIETQMNPKVSFITAQALEDLYPTLTPEEREREFARAHGTIFISRIGWPLESGQVHSLRAPDYDDWRLNGDLIVWNPILEDALELSSMGIRVDAESLNRQLEAAGTNDRRKFRFHQEVLNNELPLTMGGGIGQSRLCMYLLGCCHIGEVQASIWDEKTRQTCRERGITLL